MRQDREPGNANRNFSSYPFDSEGQNKSIQTTQKQQERSVPKFSSSAVTSVIFLAATTDFTSHFSSEIVKKRNEPSINPFKKMHNGCDFVAIWRYICSYYMYRGYPIQELLIIIPPLDTYGYYLFPTFSCILCK